MPKKGYKPTEEHRRKLSESGKGKLKSEETKKRIRKNHAKYWKGKKRSEETKQKMSISRKGKKYFDSEETKIKKSKNSPKYWLGKNFLEETKKKMSDSHKGKKSYNMTEEIRKKMSESHKGKKGKTRSDETKKKISISKMGKKRLNVSGKNHWNWKNGRSALKDIIRQSFEYRQWKCDVFTRDNFTCHKCGLRGVRLESHHIKCFSIILKEYCIKTIEQAVNCSELWNINNGITFCKKCHVEFHKIYGKENNNEEQLKKFLA